MTNIELANECGAEQMTAHGPHLFSSDAIDAFAERIKRAERERCAVLAHNKALHCEEHDNHYGRSSALDIEDAIRQEPK